MKKTTLFIAMSLAAFSFASAAQAPAVSATAPAAGNAMYCWKSRLVPTNDGYTCNWAATVDEACKGPQSSDLAKSDVTGEPAKVKRCGNGEWLVQTNKK